MSEENEPLAPGIRDRKQEFIAVLAIVAIAIHLILRFAIEAGQPFAEIPLWIAFLLGGTPLVYELIRKAFHREFGSDLLAGISIITSLLLGEYLAGSLVVLDADAITPASGEAP